MLMLRHYSSEFPKNGSRMRVPSLFFIYNIIYKH